MRFRHKKQPLRLLLQEMDETKKERERLENQLEFTNDALILEHLMFSLRATDAKWRYLWSLAKEEKEMYEEAKITFGRAEQKRLLR